MLSMKLDVSPQDLHFLDKFLRRNLAKPPVDSLRSHGSPSADLKVYRLQYQGHIRIDEKEYVFEVRLSADQDEISAVDISVKSASPKWGTSEEEKADMLRELVSRIRESEQNTKEKLLKTFDHEAHLSTSIYPLESTVEFGQYKLSPLEKRGDEGWECKLTFRVEAIDEDDSVTYATIEAKKMAAYLSTIFGTTIRFRSLSETTVDQKAEIHLEKIERPDLRPVKRPFASELKNHTTSSVFGKAFVRYHLSCERVSFPVVFVSRLLWK